MFSASMSNFPSRDGYYGGSNTTLSRYTKQRNVCTRKRVRAHVTPSLLQHLLTLICTDLYWFQVAENSVTSFFACATCGVGLGLCTNRVSKD